jgi:hypothetical protein
MRKSNRDFRGFGWGECSRGRFATPADFPRHDCSPYRGLRVRRWGLGFFRRSRAFFCRAVPNLSVTIRKLFSIACRCGSARRPPWRRCCATRRCDCAAAGFSSKSHLVGFIKAGHTPHGFSQPLELTIKPNHPLLGAGSAYLQ